MLNQDSDDDENFAKWNVYRNALHVFLVFDSHSLRNNNGKNKQIQENSPRISTFYSTNTRVKENRRNSV